MNLKIFNKTKNKPGLGVALDFPPKMDPEDENAGFGGSGCDPGLTVSHDGHLSLSASLLHIQPENKSSLNSCVL